MAATAQIVAQTICECDGLDWMTINPAERDRYARIGLLVEDRIRKALLDGKDGIRFAEDLIGLHWDDLLEVAPSSASRKH